MTKTTRIGPPPRTAPGFSLLIDKRPRQRIKPERLSFPARPGGVDDSAGDEYIPSPWSRPWPLLSSAAPFFRYLAMTTGHRSETEAAQSARIASAPRPIACRAAGQRRALSIRHARGLFDGSLRI